ncbi:hypothetical protein EBS67_07965 [bacterium]|nr:hypothetical protein [Verrucomicrobiota bacterium]NBS89925.1 hypothetical protein [bacterium]
MKEADISSKKILQKEEERIRDVREESLQDHENALTRKWKVPNVNPETDVESRWTEIKFFHTPLSRD